jgi:hypothetical protein
MRTLFSFLDLGCDTADFKKLEQELIKKDPKHSLNRPCDEHIVSPRDDWASYDSQLLKFGFETVANRVALFSFSPGYRKEFESFLLDETILDLLQINSREELRSILGPPRKSIPLFDQYLYGDTIVIGALSYPAEDDTITSYHFGSRKVFSNPDLIPNRFGFTLESVTLLEREDGSLAVDFN